MGSIDTTTFKFWPSYFPYRMCTFTMYNTKLFVTKGTVYSQSSKTLHKEGDLNLYKVQ